MKAADTRASRAIADWTPLAVVCRSLITAEIDTFMSDVSTTKTNMAMASKQSQSGISAFVVRLLHRSFRSGAHDASNSRPGCPRVASVRQYPFRPVSPLQGGYQEEAQR